MRPDQPTSSVPPLPDLSSLLVDRNRDGFPDDIVGSLVVPDGLNTETWTAVINLAARLGLSSSGFTPPLVASRPPIDRVSITVRNGDAERLNALTLNSPEPEHRHPGDSSIGEQRTSVDLADTWSIRGFLTDRDGDQAADDAAIHIIVPDDLPDDVGAALADFAARIGIECAGMRFPVAGNKVPAGRIPFRIELTDDPEARIESSADGSVRLTGTTESTAGLLRHLARLASGFLPDTPGTRALDWLRRSVAGWTPEGRAAYLHASLTGSDPDRVLILDQHPESQELLGRVTRDTAPGTRVDLPSPRETVVFDHQWTAEWEVDRLMRTLEEDVLPRLDPSLPVELTSMISESPAVRRRVRGQISRRMLGHGFNHGQVHVLDAFKPGLCWLQEVILPALSDRDPVDSVTIRVKEWDPDSHDGQLDLRIRWLQELFPVDELLATELGIAPKRIEYLLEREQTEIYRVTARGHSGEPVLDRGFSPLWRRINYLSGMPDAGNVTVTTGGIIARQAGEAHQARVLTDPEVFWRYVQGELQPGLRRFILGESRGTPVSSQQPLFDELSIVVRISASDHPYGIRQERHSSAEALHEDIYFNVLDFIEELGKRTSGQKLSAPGSVRPFVHVSHGRQPEARIRLTRRPAEIARIVDGGAVESVRPAVTELPLRATVSALAFRDHDLVLELDPQPEAAMPPSFLRSLAATSGTANAGTILRIPDGTGFVEIQVPDESASTWPESIATGRPPAGTIISNPELPPFLNRLDEHPQVELRKAVEISWKGRPIPALMVTAPQQATIWSARKLSHFKPTLLIVARHHANEVASTTAALQLTEALVNDRTGSAMLRGVNVVLIPLENPDGAALHDELRRDNPTWKHHPARYNATGFEFAEDQGNPDSRYGEARVRDLVWSACLPDIVVDNHGVPSHEWAQLFAGGGSPPRFGVSYWQVQALLYGILPYLNESDHRTVCFTVRDRVADAVAADPNLLHWNRTYNERYYTWGTRWVPDRFPQTLYRDMLFHVQPIDPDSARGRRSYAARFPRTTVLNWITEVCDETVEGEELERTARAHLVANKAVLELLRESFTGMHTRSSMDDRDTYVRVGRERPWRIDDRAEQASSQQGTE